MNHVRPLLAALSGLALVLTGISASSAPPPTLPANGVSALPAMGWSSWSFVRRWPDRGEDQGPGRRDGRAAGLAAHGFVYVNLDDFWQKCDANGFVVDSYGRWAVDTAQVPHRHQGAGRLRPRHRAEVRLLRDAGHRQERASPGTPRSRAPRTTRRTSPTPRRPRRTTTASNMYYIDYGKPGAQAVRQLLGEPVRLLGRRLPEDRRRRQRATSRTSRPGTRRCAPDRPARSTYALSNNLPIADAATWQQLANSWRTQGDVECYCGSGLNGSGYPLTDWSHVVRPVRLGRDLAAVRRSRRLERPDSLEIGNGDQVGLTADQRRSHVHAVGDGRLAAAARHRPDRRSTATDLAMLTNDRLIGVDQDGVAAKRIVDQRRQAGLEQEGDRTATTSSPCSTPARPATPRSASTGRRSASPAPADVTDLWSGSARGHRGRLVQRDPAPRRDPGC